MHADSGLSTVELCRRGTARRSSAPSCRAHVKLVCAASPSSPPTLPPYAPVLLAPAAIIYLVLKALAFLLNVLLSSPAISGLLASARSAVGL